MTGARIRLQSEHGAFLRTEILPAGHPLPEVLLWTDAQFVLAEPGADGVPSVYRRQAPGPVAVTPAKVTRVVVVSALFDDLRLDGTVPA